MMGEVRDMSFGNLNVCCLSTIKNSGYRGITPLGDFGYYHPQDKLFGSINVCGDLRKKHIILLPKKGKDKGTAKL